MKKELISIIVPIYNASKYLNECINSIRNQTYEKIEIILVNDGSTDDSLKICMNHSKEDNRIKVIDKVNTGVSDTRNLGMKEASGNYILFVDSDDYLDYQAIEKAYLALKNNSVDVVRVKAKRYNKNGEFEEEKFYSYNNIKVEGNAKYDLLNNFLTDNNNISCYSWALLIRKEKAVKFNTKLSYMEDTEFYVRLIGNIDSIYFLGEPLYSYRYNEQSVTKNPNKILTNIYAISNSVAQIREYLHYIGKDSEDLINKMFEKISDIVLTNINYYLLDNARKNKKFELKELLHNPMLITILKTTSKNTNNRLKRIKCFLLYNRLYYSFITLLKLINIIKRGEN